MIRVLVVDDSAETLALLVETLEAAGATALVALRGEHTTVLSSHPHCSMGTYLFVDPNKNAVPASRFMDIGGQITQAIDGIVNNPIVQLGVRAVLVYVVLIWLASAWWAFRDMQHRTSNPIAPFLAANS